MLEEKIRNVGVRVTKVILPLVAAVSLTYIAGCGDDKPSKYCCEAMKCGEEGNPPVCDGSGDDCYCREASCCEKRDCESSGMECSPGYEGCQCTQRYNGKY